MVPDPVAVTETLEEATFELGFVVSDDGPGDPKAGDNVILYEFHHIRISDVRQRLCLYPFGEVVCRDQ